MQSLLLILLLLSPSRLRQYVHSSGGLASVSVYMKVEKNRLQTNRFYLFDKDHSLGDNLRGKTVVEYPTLHIVMADSISSYPLVSHQIDEEESKSLCSTAEPSDTQPTAADSSPVLSSSTATADLSTSSTSTVTTSSCNDHGSMLVVQCPVQTEEGDQLPHKLTVECSVEHSEDRNSSVWSSEEEEMDSLGTTNALQMIASVYDNN